MMSRILLLALTLSGFAMLSTVGAQTVELKISASPEYGAGGKILIGRTSIDCTSAKCSASVQVPPGKVGVKFVPNAVSNFVKWVAPGTPCNAKSDTTCEMNVSSATELKFGVLPKKYKVSVSWPPPSMGSVFVTYSSSPGGVQYACTNKGDGTPCVVEWEAGRPLNFKADPSALYELASWSGACSGKTCSLNLTGDTFLGVNVALRKFYLNISVVGSAPGKIFSNPPAINCGASGGTCKATFTAKDMVTLLAEPGNANVQTVWGNAQCEAQKTPDKCVLSIGGNIDMTVVFKNK